ncbi:four-carbon acid sugar kinase family protein, partial [Propionibacterium sp.]|uniref:four-carbon acid sugar kinase family protein n=1 Tax=Propionibacterium sp. TaxID=1977903 RepID=UPI00345E3AE9
MSPIGIVADDLTGATTVGALIAREGVDSTVLFDTRFIDDSPLPDDGALIVSTDSRAMEPEVAFNRVSRATTALLKRGIRQFSKRTDTTLRGGIGPEVEGMLSALPDDYLAIIVPAMPQSRRVVVGGYSLIDSELLSRTGVAQDVRTPVTESHVPTLLASQFMAKLGHVPIQSVMAGKQAIKHDLVELRREDTRAFVLDAVTMDDIDQIAQAVVDLRWKVICVDPGPFTDRLAVRSGAITPRAGVERTVRLEPADGESGTVLLVAGSATAVTHDQFSALREVPGTQAVS